MNKVSLELRRNIRILRYSQVARSNIIESNLATFSLVVKDRSVAASLHCLFFGHLLQLRRSYSLGMLGTNADTTILKELEKDFTSLGAKETLVEKTHDGFLDTARYVMLVEGQVRCDITVCEKLTQESAAPYIRRLDRISAMGMSIYIQVVNFLVLLILLGGHRCIGIERLKAGGCIL